MRNIITAFYLLFMLSLGFAQNKNTSKADAFFDSYQYVSAIEEYLKLAENKNATSYVYSKLADSYYNIFNPDEAAKWYAKAVEGKKVDAEVYYRYAQTLKSLGKYKEANSQMEIFSKLLPNDSRAKEFKENPNYIPSLSNQTKMFDVAETSISYKNQSSFGAILTNENELYFTSTKNTSKRTDKSIDQPYLDIYKAKRNDNGTFSEAESINELNTPYHDGPVSISSDGKTMFFARDGLSEGSYQKDKTGNLKVGQQGIYKAIKIGDKWSNIESLPINSIKYSVTNPSLSIDGKTLYFASDMPGGIGESDIWKISIEGNNYGKPENLGPKVNTAGKENFPFITEDDILYFGSMGKQGFGGLDVYKIDLKTNDDAINVGKPVNSEKDDFSFSFNKKANIGFFSSNRNGFDAVFSATPICKTNAIIVVTNKKSGEIINNASVTILDNKGNTIQSQKTNTKGMVQYEVECGMYYSLQVSADNYETATAVLEKSSEKETTTPVQLLPEEVIITEKEVILKSIYFDFDKSNITAQGAKELDKLVNVMKKYPEMVIFVKSHTDSKGKDDYNLKLSEQRAQATVQYVISKGIDKERITGKGFGSTEPKINCGKKCTDEQHAQNRRSEFLIVKK
ncbi:OmpA family protein [Flavobacterium capsici]|uniref:OmpA family protein n=1 Tax=Flavobacterium capsici TaxID=3075618 RepID=A0AA96F131_9FLAO|nr:MULTISPECIES: OmpA family protein [unclassified Flavobacterium]WNM19604.1 OmpA family protein [Flavobacterium sp. PMR2A8]WNM20993.1 OmpA family protein [Flavobacterium sp. PMTSA4]